jgi:hypothetical protein
VRVFTRTSLLQHWANSTFPKSTGIAFQKYAALPRFPGGQSSGLQRTSLPTWIHGNTQPFYPHRYMEIRNLSTTPARSNVRVAYWTCFLWLFAAISLSILLFDNILEQLVEFWNPTRSPLCWGFGGPGCDDLVAHRLQASPGPRPLRKEISGFVTAGSNPFLQKDEPEEASSPGEREGGEVLGGQREWVWLGLPSKCKCKIEQM